jgi:hypothetical protein
MGFSILLTTDDKEKLTYQNKRYIQTQKRGKYLSRSGAYLILDSGAYIIREEEKNY